MNCKTIEDCLACPKNHDCLNNKARTKMNKDNKKKKVTDFDKVLDSFCTDQADLVRASKGMHDLFESLVEGGFTEEQAMTFLVYTVMGLLGGVR